MASGHGFYGANHLGVPEWFELAHFFSLLARKLIVASTSAYKHLATLFGLTDLLKSQPPPRDRIEILRIHHRQLLLKAVAALMEEGPHLLQKFLQEAQATRQTLCSKGVLLPKILQPIFKSLPDNPKSRKRSNTKKSNPPKPTQRHLVKKQMEHIMRLVKEQKP
ncbi:hypothetical protein [uncultured Pseudodesulfovibrio sp.]|uniref:hypothetical protein n=1 Tax=uncultured Pseudodesulfovibrio sp. TaxID=2035858 RepID=UPI0029C73B94|nr:hypothetical protein [uncultured Pseudodesulfovibrio sp.]